MPSRDSEPQIKQSEWYLPLLLIGFGGLCLRWGALGYLDVWHDELFSLDIARQNFSEFGEFVRSGEDYHPPGFYFSLQLARLAGASGTFTLRVLNLFWYLPLFLGMGLYARQSPESRRPLLIATASIAFGPTFVYHGAELRMYSMLLASSTLGLMAAHLAVTSHRWRWFVAFGFASLLGALTHYSSALVSLSIAVAMLIQAKDRMYVFRGCALAGLITVVGLLPLADVLGKHMAKHPAYTIPVLRSLLYVGLGTTVPLVLVVIGRAIWTRRYKTRVASTSESHGLGGFALVSALAFLGVFLIMRGATGMNLVNTGVALVPASWLILAAAFWVAPRTRSRMSLLLVGILVGNLALGGLLLHDPSVLTSNRLSTITKFGRLVDQEPLWAQPSSRRAIVHIDWPRDNEYFRSMVAAPASLESIAYVSTGSPQNVTKAIRQLAADGAEEILLLTRGRLKEPMAAGLEADFKVQKRSRGVAVVTRTAELRWHLQP